MTISGKELLFNDLAGDAKLPLRGYASNKAKLAALARAFTQDGGLAARNSASCSMCAAMRPWTPSLRSSAPGAAHRQPELSSPPRRGRRG